MLQEDQNQTSITNAVAGWGTGQKGRKRLLFALFAALLLLDGLVLCSWLGLFNLAEMDFFPLVRKVGAAWIVPALNDRPLHIPAVPAVTETLVSTPAVTSTTPPAAFQKQLAGLFARSTQAPTAFLPVMDTPTPAPTETPEPTATVAEEPTQVVEAIPLPEGAQVAGLYGIGQSLALSCEARSATDWARFFGYKINEVEFQHALSKTDNPETGFVGNPNDVWGMIPPSSYGVHAGPVADLLHNFGVPARAYRDLGFDDIRREIAEGRPVIVWVVGGVWEGEGVEYTASDGQTTIVAANEHTVMVAGYTLDGVLIQDGGYRYYVTVSRFRDSWRVLGNMAIFEK